MISIHVLREEDDGVFDKTELVSSISIHVLREEDDIKQTTQSACMQYFNPRPPRGGRPEAVKGDAKSVAISIHVLREEDDIFIFSLVWTIINFNPRPPRGGRHTSSGKVPGVADFNPRPPRGGRRRCCYFRAYNRIDFNPRPPRGGRQYYADAAPSTRVISIHVLREEDDPPRPRLV